MIGVEFATIFNKLGSKVTIIEMLPQIIATEDDKVIQALTYLLQKDGITIFTESKVTGVSTEKEKVKVAFQDKEGKPQIVETEKVLMAIGRAPYTEGLGLEKIGIDFEGKFIKVNSKMETNVPGIYAIGDVVGNLMLAHVASAEGIVAAENIMGGNSYMEYEKVPNCIYTSPEIASVGLTEQEAREKGYKVSVGTFPYQFSGRALAIEEPEGFVKIIAKKELGEILGVHIIGENATDLIGEGLLAMELEASVEELGKIVKGHPTF
ncbi:Dihydrolipoyl dehydrogenase [subsurface metagenome]